MYNADDICTWYADGHWIGHSNNVFSTDTSFFRSSVQVLAVVADNVSGVCWIVGVTWTFSTDSTWKCSGSQPTDDSWMSDASFDDSDWNSAVLVPSNIHLPTIWHSSTSCSTAYCRKILAL